MRLGKAARVWALVTVLGVTLCGCGDSNWFEGQSDESGSAADRENGVEALNAGNWDKAIDIFGKMDQTDPDVIKYLASAYVGKAGFDTLTLIDEIAKAEESGMDGEDIIYEQVTRLFDDDGDGDISREDLGEKAALIESALEVLGLSFDAVAGRVVYVAPVLDTTGMTDTQVFQAGLYSALHAVLSIVEQLGNPNSPEAPLPLTLAALHAAENAYGAVSNVTVPTGFDMDLAWVQAAVEVLDPTLVAGAQDVDGNDIADELNQFLTDIGFRPGREVTDPELVTYLLNLIN